MTVAIRCGLLLLAGGAGIAGAGDRLKPTDITPAVVQAGVQRGLTFLLGAQNPDGSWGGAARSITTWSGDMWTSPESHRSWRVATTGLCCLALLQVGDSDAAHAALDRGLDYLVANACVKRPNDWDTMNCWADVYGLQALAAALQHPRYAASPRCDEFRRAAETHLRQMAYSQSLSGGWGYLEFNTPRTARPQWATSFTTASAIIALVEARAAGLPVDADVVRRAVRAVRRCRLPNGAYDYSVSAIPNPGWTGSVNGVKGSLARIQSCNLALLRAGERVPREWLQTGLEQFFREHRFLDIALHKPVPHEAFYQNSGYFYLYGHYYAAEVIACLPPAQRDSYWPRLQYEVLKLQQADGSVWDYDHHAYAKPYGTAYALLALGRSIDAGQRAGDLDHDRDRDAGVGGQRE